MAGEEIVPLVGNIYRKCSAFVSEIDDMITLESFEYAEKQLRVAGANAKEACSKVVEGMLPEFLTDSLRLKTPLQNKQDCEVAVSESFKSEEEGHELVEIVAEDNQVTQSMHDVVNIKDINVEAPCVLLVDDSCSMSQSKKTCTSDLLEQCDAQSKEVMETEEKCECLEVTGSDLLEQFDAQSKEVMETEEKCECLEVTGSVVHNPTDCRRKKHQLKLVHAIESELQDEDFCESDWVMV